jgi:hypothetical protein
MAASGSMGSLGAEQELNAKQLISSGQSSEEPVGQGCSQESASSLVLPQKKVEVTLLSSALVHDVNGRQDSPDGQSFDEPDGHGSKHLAFASSILVPQK